VPTFAGVIETKPEAGSLPDVLLSSVARHPSYIDRLAMKMFATTALALR
jgi:hypothetical protein